MPNKVDMLDGRIAHIARAQQGVITAKQLTALGLGRPAVSERASRGRLHRAHRGVYAVGHPGLSLHGRWMAAVLACGEGAVLSHSSAAALWGLLKPIDGPVHVSVPTTAGRVSRRGIRLHRCASLDEPTSSPSYLPVRGRRGRRFVTARDRIPVTTVGRTIEDLRTSPIPPRLVRRAIRQAEFMGLRLDGVESDRTRSDLETAFLTLCRRHGLSLPGVNVKLGRWEVDFLWRGRRLVVETDSWTYHRGSVAFEDDHARDLDLRQQGFTVLRFTDRQIEEEPGRVVEDLARALGR